MSVKKKLKNRISSAILGVFFAIISIFAPVMTSASVFAEPENDNNGTVTTEENTPTEVYAEYEGEDIIEGFYEETETEATEEVVENEKTVTSSGNNSCKKQLGVVGWLVCPAMEAVSNAVDALYSIIRDFLIIKPLSISGDSPVYVIWQYCLGVTNIVFIIFLLIVVYSQITGVGISNYGIKKALPKLIIAAILVNLSYHICILAVDVSNIVGESLRGLFEGVTTQLGNSLSAPNIPVKDVYGSVIAGMGVGTLAGVIAVEAGSVWMFIPTILGGLFAVISGLITIALRQAVVILLVMISPLALVCYMLPNTEKLFKKWKDLFIKMLVFYPAFSLLFGASSLAGWAIISSADNIFVVMLGLAVQIFPLFASWSLMKMSGTFLSGINAKISSLGAPVVNATRGWAASHAAETRSRTLAKKDVYTPSAKLMQFMSDRRVSRDSDTKENTALALERGLAYNASRHYTRKGVLSDDGINALEMQGRRIGYKNIIETDRINFEEGFRAEIQGRNAGRVHKLNEVLIENADGSKFIAARASLVDARNAESFNRRTSAAIDAHMDSKNALDVKSRMHDMSDAERAAARERYKAMYEIAGSEQDVQYLAAEAAYASNAQKKIIQGRMQTYFENTVPTQDVVNRLKEFTTHTNSSEYMDNILAGLRTLSQRGDTDILKARIDEICADGKLKLGTSASQALAGFLMFEVKDSDPYLRRFGKYINLETARVYNDNQPDGRRKKLDFDMDEYALGYYREVGEDGQSMLRKSKADAATLLNGTSFKGIERTALSNMSESIQKACTDANGHVDVDKYIQLQEKVFNAILPNFIGDALTYTSGSEQSVAAAQLVTGINAKGEKVQELKGVELSEEEQKKLDEFHQRRTKTYLNAQVPNQLAHSKTDMIAAISTMYRNQSADEFNREDFNSDAEYNQRLEESSNEKFRESLNKNTYYRTLSMFYKGYQGDTKESLAKILKADDPETIKIMKRWQKTHEIPDNDGMATQSDTDTNYDGTDPTSMVVNGQLRTLYDSYAHGNQSDANARMSAFQSEVHRIINENYGENHQAEIDARRIFNENPNDISAAFNALEQNPYFNNEIHRSSD